MSAMEGLLAHDLQEQFSNMFSNVLIKKLEHTSGAHEHNREIQLHRQQAYHNCWAGVPTRPITIAGPEFQRDLSLLLGRRSNHGPITIAGPAFKPSLSQLRGKNLYLLY